VTILSENEIVAFETFPYGSEILMDMIADTVNVSSLQIENIICTPSLCNGIHETSIRDFLSYIVDMIFAYFRTERIDITFDHLLLHGNIFENHVISTIITELLREPL
jgi:hypothetical protein